MNKLCALVFGLAIALFGEFALAAAAVVASVEGSAQLVKGTGTPRALRLGDSVSEGETVVTGASSTLGLVFEDGHIVALPANSRLTVTSYVYDRGNAAKSKVSLSLSEGGMRAVTGKIGRQNPSQVVYLVKDSTIRILGTDITVGTVGGNLAISVTEGSISFTFQGKTTTVNAGEGVDARTDGTVRKAALAAFIASLSPAMKAVFSDMDRIVLNRLIQQAGQQDLRDNPVGSLSSTPSASSSAGGGASTR